MNEGSVIGEWTEKKESRRSLLIVDDAVLNRIVLKKIFCRDYEILEAGDGEKALELIASCTDLCAVILDLNMPKLDGFEVMKRMSQQEAFQRIPVIVVTGEVEAEYQNHALDYGAQDVITKPFHSDIIKHRVNNIIERQQALELTTKMRLTEERLYLSTHDGLTGLSNRFAFLSEARKRINESKDELVLSCINIDGFKLINERYGHSEGDRLLRFIGEFVNETVKETGGLACRDMADLFLVLLKKDDLLLAETFQKLLKGIQSFEPRMELFVQIGSYVIDDPSLEVNQMIDRALLAVRSLKNNLNRNIAWFQEEMQRRMLRDQELLSEMKTGLINGEFVAFFQPQYDSKSSRLCGAEVLARWNHKTKGMLYPSEFVPLFEQNNCISALDRYIWEEACKQLSKWLLQGLFPTHLSVNISRRDVYALDLISELTSLCEKYSLSPELLHLEITESAYVENKSTLQKVVEQLQQKGFLVEMDDFGSGYSSLNILKDVPVDCLKLDMKFCEESENTERGRCIMSAVVRMAEDLKLPVIAEGVETETQADFLRDIGCTSMQGFFFSKPLSVEEFEEILVERKARGGEQNG